MLFVFLALYVALGVGCLVLGIRRRTQAAVVCGVIAVTLAAASFVVWILYSAGATHWTVSLLQALLSPMPESLLAPESLDAADGSGLSALVTATLELIAAIALWAVPILGIIVAERAPRAERSS